jgi:hypothetical protein
LFCTGIYDGNNSQKIFESTGHTGRTRLKTHSGGMLPVEIGRYTQYSKKTDGKQAFRLFAGYFT